MLLGLGAFGGFCAGLLGIGGGMILVPFITMLLAREHVAPELIVRMAIATSMATILFTSLSSVRAHHARGAVLWPVVRLLAPGILLSQTGQAVFLPVPTRGELAASLSSSALTFLEESGG